MDLKLSVDLTKTKPIILTSFDSVNVWKPPQNTTLHYLYFKIDLVSLGAACHYVLETVQYQKIIVYCDLFF